MQEPTINDQEHAIRWLLENRRAEVCLHDAIKTLRNALHGDATGLAILKTVEAEAAQ
jgi:hypothetical protein